MNKAQWHLDFNPNVGIIDRFARYILSLTLIGIVLVAEQVPVGWVVILPLIAIPIFISAFSAWDPIYALFQKAPAPISSLFKKRIPK